MRKYTTHCDYCKKQIEETESNGFCVELGYSTEATSGWGRRRDFISKHSVEICNDCFREVEKKSKELVSSIEKLKSSNLT